MYLGVRPVLVGRTNSLMSEFWSLLLLHGLSAVAGRRKMSSNYALDILMYSCRFCS